MLDVGQNPVATSAADKDNAAALKRRNLKSPSPPQSAEADLLDRLARDVDQIRAYSATALGIAIAAVLLATLLRLLGGWAPNDLRFGVYVTAILATGLVAGVPAATGATAASLLVVAWAFVPPYFAFKVPNASDQISLALAAFASLLTIYFAHCCRAVLRRLHQRELANKVLVDELKHRGRNLFAITQVILGNSLADQPQRADEILGRLRSVQSANELLTGSQASPLTIKALLFQEFVPYGESRLAARGPEVKVSPATARALLLLFHELVTNAAKYGALSRTGGLIVVEWRCKDERRVELAWKESGGPAVSCQTRKGFGSQLVNACIKDLAGTIRSDFAPAGYSCLMSFRI
jgi:two-component sensor histidine kinase